MPRAGVAELTTRELDVLRLVAEGRANSQIASALFISPKTVSVHISNALAKRRSQPGLRDAWNAGDRSRPWFGTSAHRWPHRPAEGY